jgi:NADH-quinone oxidoreductase subunit L
VDTLSTISNLMLNSSTGLALSVFILPLFSFILLMLLKSNKAAHSIALASVGLCFLASLILLYETYTNASFAAQLPWLEIGSIKLNLSIKLDKYAALMLSMISLISFLVMLYSTEYMKGEKRYNYFFAYISLFAFAMFGLVLSSNLMITYIFWEMVGFCSYLLIGFYTQKKSAILANKKAFIINRIGDLGFLAGIMILLSVFRSLDLQTIYVQLNEAGTFVSNTDKMLLHYAGYAFFIAVIAKSAQFPLHVWLPDAMEGPTPVSALIHAATMVISGVYLLFRIFFLLDVDVLNLVALIGSFTAFMGAFIAGRQFDIKKILAYSTISQLGYMVMAVGLSAPQAAFYHLYTHAFFKAALFLGAGSIIHYLHHQYKQKNIHLDAQDIRNMGGLRKELPFTFYVYTLAAAALVGIPFLSGFFSKEAILAETWNRANTHSGIYVLVPLFAFASVLMTAFYVFRHYTMVFFGKSKMEFSIYKESIAFKIPFIILGIACIYMYPLYEPSQHIGLLPYLTVLLISIGFAAAYLICYRKLIKPFNEQNIIYKLSYNAFYLDNIYQYLFIKPIHFILHKLQPVDLKFDKDMVHGLGNVVIHFSHFISWIDRKIIDALVNFVGTIGLQLSYLAAWVDENIIDALVLLVAKLTRRTGDFIRAFQTGKVQSYFALSAVLLIVFIWFIMKGL